MRLLLILCVTLPQLLFSQLHPGADSLINAYLQEHEIPGLAASIIKDGEIVHLGAYGYQDLKEGKKVETSTPFQIASVSKTVICMAIFQLVEQGKLKLNDNINQHLPFEVQNPHLGDDEITIASLLNHRSGIRDNFKVYQPFWSIPKGDPKIPLKAFLKDYLVKEGAYYSEDNFAKEENRKDFSYCNTAYALLGLLISEISDMSLEDYSQKNMFRKLEMENTSWFLKHLTEAKVAKPYVKNEEGEFEFKGHNGYPDYPAGQLRTSIKDFSKLVLAYLDKENTGDLLSMETRDLISPSPSIAHQGFYTWFPMAIGKSIYYTHGGGDTGVSTFALIDPQKGNAVIVFTNSASRFEDLVRSLTIYNFD